METLKWIAMIIGIFVFIYFACMMILKSEERQKKNNQKIKDNQRQIQELNTQLDDTIQQLEDINPMLEKVTGYICRFNEKVFPKK